MSSFSAPRRIVAILVVALGLMPAFARGDPRDAGLAVLDHLHPSRTFVSGPVTAIAVAKDGMLFVGSTQVAMYDGSAWHRIETPGAKRIYAFAPADGRTWVAGLGIIGYVSRTPASTWTFHSLSAELGRIDSIETEDIRHIHPFAGGAIFVGRSRVLRWDGAKFTVWELPSPERLHAFSNQDSLIIHQVGVGLLRMDDDGPHLVLAQEKLPSVAPLVGWTSLREGAEFAVFSDEAFRRDGDHWIRLEEISTILRAKQATRAAPVDENCLAIGTFLGGVILLRADGAIDRVIGTLTGLIDDNVLTLTSDLSGGLWIGMSRGIALLSAARAAALFDQRAGINTGVIRKVLNHGERPYVLTSRSLFSLSPRVVSEPQAWPKNERAWTELWDATTLDGQLWIAGSTGLWEVSATGVFNRYRLSTDMLLLAAPKFLPHSLVLFENNRCEFWEKAPTGWGTHALELPLGGMPVSVIEHGESTIWVATISGRISELKYEEATRTFRRNNSFEVERGSPIPVARPLLSSVGRTVVAFTENAVLAHESDALGFAPISAFEKLTGVAAAAIESSDSAYWIIQSKELGAAGPPALIRVDHTPDGTFHWTPIALPGLDQVGQVTSLNLTSTDHFLWIGGTNAVLRFEISGLREASEVPTLALQDVQTDAPAPEVRRDRGTLSIGPRVNRVEFNFPAGVAVGAGEVAYQTRLDGVEGDWTTPQSEPKRQFTRLTAGSYVFLARAVDRFGRYGPALRLPFVVEPPWYRRPAFLTLSAILCLVIIATGVRLRLQQLHLQRDRLNRLVAERTRELSLANTAKSEFLENISHEIRNPLQGVVGLISLLEEERLESRARELARSLKACAQSLHRVFDEVLGFSKLEYGFVSVEPRPFLLRRVLQDVCSVFSSAALAQGSSLILEFSVEWSDGFQGDEEKIKTIVGNFISNALKYAPGTPVTISVSRMASTEHGSSDESPVLIEVVDRGPGVSADEQELIFQKFVRGASARRSKAAGTGIGLTACRALAKMMGGSVGVESSPGRGATFFVQLPLPRAELSSAEGIPALATALIVDDQAYNQVVLSGMIQPLGFEVVVVDNAAAAYSAATETCFALVLLDLELPGEKGPEIARRLRQLPGWDSPVVLAISAHDSPDAQNRCIEAGMDSFLLKPVTREQIRDAFAEALNRRSTRMAGLDYSSLELYARSTSGGIPKAARTYLEILDEEIALLKSAVADANPSALLTAVHRVHSHAAIIRADGLFDAAQQLETKVRNGYIPENETALGGLLAETAKVRLLLSAYLSPPVPAGG